MIDLSKQQLILLALLVSFVTSLATGIVTVSLMDQAPAGVTRTVSQVIEKTIQQIVPQQNAAAGSTAVESVADKTADAVASVLGSTVKLTSGGSDSVVGTGLVVSSRGLILTDKMNISTLSNYVAIFSDGTKVPVAVALSQNEGDIVILTPLSRTSAPASSTPIVFASAPVLGQTVFSLSGTSTPSLGQGVITEISSVASSSPGQGTQLEPIKTSIPLTRVSPGSPLFDLSGDVIGMRTSSMGGSDGSDFYPISQLKNVIKTLK